MNIKEEYNKHVTWEKTEIKGLKGYPVLPKDWNTRDWIEELPFQWVRKNIGGNGQFSDKNSKTLISLIKSKPNATLFVEIGTGASITCSSTAAFLNNKNDGTTFITIDCEKRTQDKLGKPNAHFITAWSTSPEVKNHLGDNKIDILFIDGDHSVKTVFEEYEFYLPYMKEDGIIVLHDTTMHPGSFLFMEAVDEKVYRKEVLHTEDYGLGIVYLK
jgi:predicted O-methyltransferase YrrM